MPNSSLFERGVIQGSYLDCSKLDEGLRSEIQESRALPGKRLKQLQASHKLLVLSQDCDIANEGDKYIELVPAKVIPRSRSVPVVRGGRNLRKLHLFEGDECWEIEAELISVVPKSNLESSGNLRVLGHLSQPNKEILLQWRVNRYARAPLPDQFNRAFFAYLHDSGTGLEDFLTNNRSEILEIFAFVDPVDDEEAEQYEVSLTLLLNIDCDQQHARQIESEFQIHIDALQKVAPSLTMIQATGGPGYHPKATNLSLIAYPADFSMEDVMRMRRLAVDFLCWDDE